MKISIRKRIEDDLVGLCHPYEGKDSPHLDYRDGTQQAKRYSTLV